MNSSIVFFSKITKIEEKKIDSDKRDLLTDGLKKSREAKVKSSSAWSIIIASWLFTTIFIRTFSYLLWNRILQIFSLFSFLSRNVSSDPTASLHSTTIREHLFIYIIIFKYSVIRFRWLIHGEVAPWFIWWKELYVWWRATTLL